jgi:hypothetical protein
MNADTLSAFCKAIIDSQFSWRELAELSATTTPQDFVLFFSEDIAA